MKNKLLRPQVFIFFIFAAVFLIASIFFYHQHIYSNVREITTITDVLNYANNADLVVFDIDSTLIVPISEDKEKNRIDWGNTNYLEAIKPHSVTATVEKYLPEIIEDVRKDCDAAPNSGIQALFTDFIENKAQWNQIELWEKFVWPQAFAEPVENETAHVIKALENKKIPVFLYTASEWDQRAIKEKELAEAGIVFKRDAIYKKTFVAQPKNNEPRGFGFENGVLYWLKNKSYVGTKIKSKGPILLKFFDAINYHPKKIVVVDDMLERIDTISSLFKKQGIKATVLWYRGIEKRIKKIDTLSAADLKVLNYYLPNGWQYPSFNTADAVAYILKKLGEKHNCASSCKALAIP